MQLMAGAGVEDSYEWIASGQNTLGAMDRTASTQLLARLKRYKCPSVVVCAVERYRLGEENTGRLVVKLPTTQPERRRAIAYLGSLAQDQGFDPDPDDGQRYGYAKLD